MSSRRRSARIAEKEVVPSPIKTTLPLKKQPLREEVVTRTKPIIPTLLKRPVAKETISEEKPLVQESSEPIEVSTSPKQTKINDDTPMTTDEKKASVEHMSMDHKSSPSKTTGSQNSTSTRETEMTCIEKDENEQKISDPSNESSADISTKQKSVVKDQKLQKPTNENLPPVKGRCKSGRFWKSERDRFRSVIKTKGLKSNLKQRMKYKEDLRRVKAYEQSLKDRVKKEKEDLRARQEQNKKNREENLRKSEVVQQVKIKFLRKTEKNIGFSFEFCAFLEL